MPEARPWGVVQDADAAGPGLIATVARLRGVELWVTRVGGPSDPAQLGALIVLSGAGRARALVAEALDERVPVLAIGAGAQLLAAMLGADVRPGIGGPPCVAPVYLTDDGWVDRVLGAAPGPLDVLHRRDLDTFDLPPGATALAMSAVDPAPAFRLSRAYGLPFHLHVDAELAARSADGPPGCPTSASVRAGVAVFDAFARMALAPRTISRRPPTSRRTP